MRTFPASLAAVALLAVPFVPAPAHAATATDTTAAFCTQLQTSQTAIAAIAPSAPNRLTLIAAEWSKIARFAPAAVKTDVNAIAAAYKAAGSQDAATQKKTLTGIVKSAQAVTAFTAKSCTGGGRGDGDGPGGADFQAQFAKLRDCVTKKGGKLPDFNPGGGQPPQGGDQGQGRGQGRGPFGNLDAKTQTAFDACRKELGFGNGRDGGGFGGGGGRNNPQVQACLKKKGVTLPTPKQGERPTLDAKTQAALDACRKELGLPDGGPGRGDGARNTNVPPSTVKA